MFRLLLRNDSLSPRGARERGALLPFIGFVFIALLGAGAYALDLSALTTRAQSLQNAADAAALAGVTEWSTTADQAQARVAVSDLMAQNGFRAESDVTWETQFTSNSEVLVTITDSDPEVYLRGALGLSASITRSATGHFSPCNPSCGSSVEIPKPLKPVNFDSDGDGYRPIVVGDKVYAVRHHDNKIACVNRTTNGLCWDTQDRALFAAPGVYTMNVTHPYVVGTRMYYIGYENGRNQWDYNPGPDGTLHVGCWETTTDTSCGTVAKIEDERHGILAGTDQGLFVFTSHRKVHCFVPGTDDECAGYENGGLPLASYSENWNNSKTATRNSTYREHDGLIYTTIAYNGRPYLQCWDTGDKAPCANFGTFEINTAGPDNRTDLWLDGRLFFSRLPSGEPRAICSTGKGAPSGADIDCYNLDSGSPHTVAEDQLDHFGSQFTRIKWVGSSAGQHTYHEGSNRTFFLGVWKHDRTYCFDWVTGDCGDTQNMTALGAPGAYGYWATSECLFGLGHREIFFTLKPDLSGGCVQGNAEIDINPCVCGDVELWPEISVRNPEGLEAFRVRVLNPDGEVIFPTDDTWLDLLAGGELKLEEVLTTFEPVKLEVIVTAALGEKPWDDGDKPSLQIVSPGFQPRLTH